MNSTRVRGIALAVKRFPVQVLIFAIELYRTYISPLRLPTCRFTPTCSEYAVEALRQRGLFVGVALTVIRLAKCAPWHPGGWDPVPARRRACGHDDSSGPGADERPTARADHRLVDMQKQRST